MKISFKLPSYIVVEVPDGTDRRLTTNAFHSYFDYAWADFLSKLRMTSDELKVIEKDLGCKPKIYFTAEPFLQTKQKESSK